MSALPEYPGGHAPPFATALARPVPLTAAWSAWRVFGLRSAGFAFDLMETLASPALEARVEDVRVADAALAGALERARRRCLAEHELRPSARWTRGARALEKGKVPREIARLPDGIALVAAIRAARAAVESAEHACAATFAEEDEALSGRVAGLAADPHFREAIAWQNRPYYRRALEPYLAGRLTGYRGRSQRTTLVKYLQRYATKNESIGFFGPYGWGCFRPDAARLEAAGPLVRSRAVRYEYWAVDALLRRLCTDEALMLATPPKLAPTARLEGDTLVTPLGALALSGAQRRFIEDCDGDTPAGTLIERYLDDPAAGLASSEAFVTLLTQLVEGGALVWAPHAPVVPDAERYVDAAIASIPEAPARARLRTTWQRIETARRAVAGAEDPDARIAALFDFDDVFSSVTGQATSRHAGRAYAGRAPLYLDCVRNVELALPEKVLTALAPALSLVLGSARWFGAAVLSRYMALVDAHVTRLGHGSDRVPLADVSRALHLEPEAALGLLDEVNAALQERWNAVLAPDPDARSQTFDSASLAPQAARCFAVDDGEWAGFAQHSPDLMLAARDVAAFDGDEWFAVLGELHPLANTLLASGTRHSAPAPQALLDRAALERPVPDIAAVKSRGSLGHRTAYDAGRPIDRHLLHDDADSPKPADRVLRIGDLWCERTGGRLVLRSATDGIVYDARQFFAPQIRTIATGRFRPFTPAPHAPRISVDRLVVQRESWHVPLGELEFACFTDRARRYLAARRWAGTLGLPRHVYYRLPGERKPMYADFHSAALVDLLLGQVRTRLKDDPAACAALALSEMLPGPEHLWLRDAAGRRYTAELRMAVYETPGPCCDAARD